MVFKIAGGIGLVLLGCSLTGIAVFVPDQVTGLFLIVGGVGLLAGI